VAGLAGHGVVVIGGSSGIGRAVVQLLVELDAHVTAVGRSPEKLRVLRDEHPSIRVLEADAAVRADLDRAFGEVGSFDDLIVTLSGGKGAGAFRELDLDDVRRGIEGKLLPQLNAVQAALPYLSPTGSFTLTTAISSRSRSPGTVGLAVVNGGLEAAVPTLAKELRPHRVNAVSPGVVDTPWWDSVGEAEKNRAFADYAAQTTVGRVADPGEIAEAILFVAGNSYITGCVIEADGGLRL
jgi:NAD(P)-dependent dehydrogenase (short-subunit alcohol dehydrogenase family)